MSKKYTWDNYLSDTDKIPIQEVSNPTTQVTSENQSNPSLPEAIAFVNTISPDLGEVVLDVVGTYIYQISNGSESGLIAYNKWCEQTRDYPGYDQIQADWNSFSQYDRYPTTRESINKLLEQFQFDPIVAAVSIDSPEESPGISSPTDPASIREFDQYSLTGTSPQLEKQALGEVFVLAGLALHGQLTVWYSRSSLGKTVLTFTLLINAIQDGKIHAKDVYYFNLDDNLSGLIAKLKIAEEIGFHLLCDGYEKFKVPSFIYHVEALCEKNQARGVILILDTLKKFTDLMSKRLTAQWNRVIRRFIAKGGTVVALAHVNKKPGLNGKTIYAGTTDMLDDADCVFMLDFISDDQETHTRYIEFENIKRRGNVVNKAAYSFSIEEELSYEELLASVEKVDENQIEKAKKSEQAKTDEELIGHVTACIEADINTKMRLRDALSTKADISKRSAIKLIEKYEGTDPEKHNWNYTVQARGKKVYSILKGGNDE